MYSRFIYIMKKTWHRSAAVQWLRGDVAQLCLPGKGLDIFGRKSELAQYDINILD